MPITHKKKEEVVSELTDALKNARVSIFADFQGTNVKDLNSLRSKIRETKGNFKVAKKTLIKRSLDEAGLSGIDPKQLKGEVGIIFGMQDAALTCKAAHQIAKSSETFKILGGFMDQVVLSISDVTQLATLPSRQELLAKLVASINAPRSGIVQVLAANIRALVHTLNAIAQK